MSADRSDSVPNKLFSFKNRNPKYPLHTLAANAFVFPPFLVQNTLGGLNSSLAGWGGAHEH